MKIKRFLLSLLLLAPGFGLDGYAQFEYGTTPDIHVEGNQLVDPQGHPVRFFGFMDTPSCWFNSSRWGPREDDSGVSNCKAYFNKLFTMTTDTVNGTFCNLFRLHLEPAWINDSNTYCRFCGKMVTLYTEDQIKKNPKYGECKYCHKPVFRKTSDGKIIDPDGQEVGGEADVHSRSMTKLKKYLSSVFYPLAESAKKQGMYVIMRPPGVCPQKIKVGSYYQQYLIDVWDIVTKNAKVKAASGWLSIELANEPIQCYGENGVEVAQNPQALRDFFQPVVDKIRENGFEGIIWVPGTGYQSQYGSYKDYPIKDSNFGYAVHNYSGWYGAGDDEYDRGRTVAQYCQQFHNQVPVLDTNPVVITEVDWSPQNTSQIDHYNEFNQPVYKNYGTWATATTSKWGVLYKGLLDKYDNISMTLTSTDDYIDVMEWINNKKTVPAFTNKMKNNGLDPMDACGAACFNWYKEYYYQQKNNYSDQNITIKTMNTTSIKDLSLSPGGASYLTINATFESGRKSNVAASCAYEVADPTVAKVFRGKVIGLGVGDTDITATYTDITGKAYSLTFHVAVTLFPLTEDNFNAALQGAGKVNRYLATGLYYDSAKNGFAGWDYGNGVDISAYDSLTISMISKPSTTSKAALRIYDQPDFEGAYAEVSVVGVNEAKVALKDLVKTDGTPLQLSTIRMAGFYTATATTIRVRSVNLSKAVTPDAIQGVEADRTPAVEIYNLGGVRLSRQQKGVNILRSADGKTRKVMR